MYAFYLAAIILAPNIRVFYSALCIAREDISFL